VGELKERGKEPYKAELTYCEHCRFLYSPIAKDFGYDMSWFVEYDESGNCTGKCKWIAGM